MPLIAKQPENNGDWEIPPQGGQPGLCIDVEDLGIVDRTYPGKAPSRDHMCRIVWLLEGINTKGARYTISQRYKVSLHEKANLRKSLESWRGRRFNEQELAGFDVEKVVGVPAYLNIVHEAKPDGRVFANIAAIMPLPKGFPAVTPDPTFVRARDRVKAPAAPAAPAAPVPAVYQPRPATLAPTYAPITLPPPAPREPGSDDGPSDFGPTPEPF